MAPEDRNVDMEGPDDIPEGYKFVEASLATSGAKKLSAGSSVLQSRLRRG